MGTVARNKLNKSQTEDIVKIVALFEKNGNKMKAF
ncbi:MAG: hypothetical protein ACI815_002094 [Psychroserpens sp.]|jgi:hypothetical protein